MKDLTIPEIIDLIKDTCIPYLFTDVYDEFGQQYFLYWCEKATQGFFELYVDRHDPKNLLVVTADLEQVVEQFALEPKHIKRVLKQVLLLNVVDHYNQIELIRINLGEELVQEVILDHKRFLSDMKEAVESFSESNKPTLKVIKDDKT